MFGVCVFGPYDRLDTVGTCDADFDYAPAGCAWPEPDGTGQRFHIRAWRCQLVVVILVCARL